MAGKQKLVSAPPSSESPGEMSVCTNYTFLLNALSYFHSTNDYVNDIRNNGNDDNRNESNRRMALYCHIGIPDSDDGNTNNNNKKIRTKRHISLKYITTRSP